MVIACQKRKILKTLYAFGEGETEVAFLKFLKRIYSGSRNRNIKIWIKNLGGKDPEVMITKAVRIIRMSHYDKKCILMDGDKAVPEVQNEKISDYQIDIIKAIPCIEGLFLEILGGNRDTIARMSSSECKAKFEEEHLNSKQKLDHREYDGIFTKELLDSKKEEINVLNTLIKYMFNDS